MNMDGDAPVAAVDAPASMDMDQILSEFGQAPRPDDAADAAVRELVEDAEEGQAPKEDGGAAEAEDEATEAVEEDAETAEEQPEEEDRPEPTYKVKVSGEEVEVPLSELLKGYSRERDYTAKTMALAEERKGLQARFAEELQQQVELFEKLDPILSEARNIDWQALAQSDPAAYVQLQAAVQERQKAVAEARQKIAQAEDGASQVDPAEQARIAQAETENLIAKAKESGLADLSEPAKMTEFAQNAVSYLRGTGFEDGEIADLTDHRALLIIEKARRFDELQRAKATLPAKKIVPKSEVKPLKSDASTQSQTTRTRFPGTTAPRERQLDWAVQQLLKE